MSKNSDSPKQAQEPVYAPHAYAEIFPPMDAEAFAALAADIKVNGLREPITINGGNQILDGLNRYRACLATDIRPRFVRNDLADNEVLPFILGRNLHRRHLTTAQRAAAAAAVANLAKDKPANLRITQAAAAKLFSVSERAVHEALGVLDQSPELHEAAIAGNVSTHMSGQIAQLPKAKREDALKKLKDGDKKGARALAKDANSLHIKKAPAGKLALRMSTPSGTVHKRRSPSFKGWAVYAPLFAELDQFADNLTVYPLALSQAQQLKAELCKAIERIDSAVKE